MTPLREAVEKLRDWCAHQQSLFPNGEWLPTRVMVEELNTALAHPDAPEPAIGERLSSADILAIRRHELDHGGLGVGSAIDRIMAQAAIREMQLEARPDAPEPVTPPWRVERSEHGGWDVVSGDTAESTTFDDEDDARNLADAMNEAFELGCKSVAAPAARRDETPKTCGSCAFWRQPTNAALMNGDCRNECTHPNRPMVWMLTNSDYGCPLHQWAEPTPEA